MPSFGGFDSWFDGGFGIMSFLFPIFFIVISGVIVFAAVAGLVRWSKNNNSPVLTVPARISNMRADVRHNHHGDNNMAHSSSTWYYATFEVESGDRMELNVSSSEYGLLAVGDTGKLTFQGTRYKSFERDAPQSS